MQPEDILRRGLRRFPRSPTYMKRKLTVEEKMLLQHRAVADRWKERAV